MNQILSHDRLGIIGQIFGIFVSVRIQFNVEVEFETISAQCKNKSTDISFKNACSKNGT